MSYKKYKWEVIAQDFSSPFLRNYIWVDSTFLFPKVVNVKKPAIGIVSENNHTYYLVDFKAWEECHNDIVKKIEKDYYWLNKFIDKTVDYGEKFNHWTEHNIFKSDLNKQSNKKLISLFKEFAKRQSTLYAMGVTLPILDLHNEYVNNNLIKVLKQKAPKDKFSKYYQIFTEPSYDSFAKEQEIALLKLMQKFYTKKFIKDIIDKDILEIQEKYPKFFRALQTHTKKYAWVYYVYMGPAFTEQQFLDFVKDYIYKKINPKKELKNIQEKKKDIAKQKQAIIKKINPNEFEKEILELVGKLIWAKPRRKDYQSKSYYHIEKLMREISKRMYISLDQARSMPFYIIYNALLNDKKIDESVANEIKSLHVCMPNNNNTITVLRNKEAKKFVAKHIKDVPVSKKNVVNSIKGTTAYPGKSKGQVKVINSSADMQKMEYGDILVSVATTPAIVSAMKKASAIVSDEGGLTCHAAIVSRELKIPCVVGTKIATQVLKDGDKVEVDAEKGIVKKI